jgi:hypothetical protein
MPFLLVDKLNRGEPFNVPVRELGQLTDNQLERCMNGEAEILRLNEVDGSYERLEFIDGLIPNWVEVQEAE